MKKLKNSLLFLGIAAICFAACTGKEESTTLEADLLRDTIPVTTAARYVANYAPHAGDAIAEIKDSDGEMIKFVSDNTRAVWFSYEQLKAMLDNIKIEKGDGVRFYFATYDKSYYNVTDTIEKKYWGHNTLVMVSTKSVKQGDSIIHQDYFVPTGGFRPKGFILGNPPENRGEMCPPPIKCDSTGAALIERGTIK